MEEIKLTEEQIKMAQEISEKARKYAWTLVKDCSYSLEEYNKYIESLNEDSRKEERKNMFTDFTIEDSFINENHLLVGYGSFGREFIEKVIDKDVDSAKNLLEVITQKYIELSEEIQEFTRRIEAAKESQGE